jgi:hypothetical protein
MILDHNFCSEVFLGPKKREDFYTLLLQIYKSNIRDSLKAKLTPEEQFISYFQ